MDLDIDIDTKIEDENNTPISDSKTNLFSISSDFLPISDDKPLLSDDYHIENMDINDKNDCNYDNNENNNSNENKNCWEARYRHKFTNIFELTENTNGDTNNIYSPPFYVRNLPWHIMLTVNVNHIGVFLQCNPDTKFTWSCSAYFKIYILINEKYLKFLKGSSHTFSKNENDWGFKELFDLNDEENVDRYFKDESVTIEIYVNAEAPYGIPWNSKKYTGYIGLKNQGATCYMNSILQTLFFTNYFRKIVYKMPTECDDSKKSASLALQKVFYNLQFSVIPVDTNCLTKSFGWNETDSFMQHDIQEFLRVLMDKLEIKMRNTGLEGSIPKLFKGEMISYIRCKNIDITSQRIETYYDIQLNINGNKDIYESFDNYIATEILDGDNKYDADEHGLQDAEKGVLFISFPPVLHLHLMRFQYDPITDSTIKFNDRFEFYEEINLNPYLVKNKRKNDIFDKKENHNTNITTNTNADNAINDDKNENNDKDDAIYLLHAVLVHSGDNNGGHYVVYINPKLDGNWCKFDDDIVSKCSKYNALNKNFGANRKNVNVKTNEQQHHKEQENDDIHFNNQLLDTNAYMLVYIRKSEIKNILLDLSKDDIPEELIERIEIDEIFENTKLELNKSNASMKQISVILDEDFEMNDRIGLFNPNNEQCRIFPFVKYNTIDYVRKTISDSFKISIKNLNLWLIKNHNQILQIHYIDMDKQKNQQILDLCFEYFPFSLFIQETNEPILMFLERKNPDYNFKLIKNDDIKFNKDTECLIFVKLYHAKHLTYMCHKKLPKKTKIFELIQILNLKFKKSIVYIERGYNPIRKLNENDCFENIWKIFMIKGNGIILIIEENNDLNKNDTDLVMNEDVIDVDGAGNNDVIVSSSSTNKMTNCERYFYNLLHPIKITFFDKNIKNDTGFILEFYETSTYSDMAYEVGKKINVDADFLQFYRSSRSSDKIEIKYSKDETVKDIFSFQRLRWTEKKLSYEKLPIPIAELENKLQFKVIMVSLDLKSIQNITLYVNKNANICDVKKEAYKYYNFDTDGTKKLRIVEVIDNRLMLGPPDHILVEVLLRDSKSKTYRIEEIPEDQMHIKMDELLVTVSHVENGSLRNFGTPFFMKIHSGESVLNIRNRIRNKLNIQKHEFDKYKLAYVYMEEYSYLSDDDVVQMSKFMMERYDENDIPIIAIEHENHKTVEQQKRTNSEMAIKIYD